MFVQEEVPREQEVATRIMLILFLCCYAPSTSGLFTVQHGEVSSCFVAMDWIRTKTFRRSFEMDWRL